MLVELIDEKWAEEENMRTGAMDTDDGESGDWLSQADVVFVNKTSVEVADHEILLWLKRTTPLPAHKSPLSEMLCASSVVPWLAFLARKVLALPATSAAPERMFSGAGHIMNKKRANLSSDHMEELVHLHGVWPTVREWEAFKRDRQ